MFRGWVGGAGKAGVGKMGVLVGGWMRQRRRRSGHSLSRVAVEACEVQLGI